MKEDENMPLYRYMCPSCRIFEKRLLSSKEAESFCGACFACGEPLIRTLGIPSTNSKETVDEYRGKSIDSDVNVKIAERAHEHWKKHDLPRIIAEQGKEYAVRQGFINDEGQVIKEATPNKPT